MGMDSGHQAIEKNVGWMVLLVILVVSVGGLVQIVPLFFQRSTTEPVSGFPTPQRRSPALGRRSRAGPNSMP